MPIGPQANIDFTKFFADMKLPALPDMEVFLSANRKNLETVQRYAHQQGMVRRVAPLD